MLATVSSLAIVLIANSVAVAQEDDSRRLADRVKSFFENLANPNLTPTAVFNELLTGSPLISPQSDKLLPLLDEYKKLEPRYGAFVEASEVDVRRVGNSLIFLTFLYKSERFPVVWRFVYYRPPSDEPDGPDWFVVRLSFDTKIEDLAQFSRGL
jgi:hypothetical protein